MMSNSRTLSRSVQTLPDILREHILISKVSLNHLCQIFSGQDSEAVQSNERRTPTSSVRVDFASFSSQDPGQHRQ